MLAGVMFANTLFVADISNFHKSIGFPITSMISLSTILAANVQFVLLNGLHKEIIPDLEFPIPTDSPAEQHLPRVQIFYRCGDAGKQDEVEGSVWAFSNTYAFGREGEDTFNTHNDHLFCKDYFESRPKEDTGRINAIDGIKFITGNLGQERKASYCTGKFIPNANGDGRYEVDECLYKNIIFTTPKE